MGDKDFFLSSDDAMSMGDINYMRKSSKTKRTFPKTLKNKDGFSFENEVSSMEDRAKFSQNSNSNTNQNTNQNISENTVFNPTPSSQSQPGITGGSAVTQTNFNQPQTNFQQSTGFDSQPKKFEAPKQSSAERRKSDDGMDMFRNMAKGMRGKR